MRPVDDLTLDLFADPEPDAPAPATSATVLASLRDWSEQGLLRHLDTALARFMAAQDPEAAPELLVATAVLVQMEGRGHSCLPLATLVADPNAVLAWPADAQDGLDALWSQLPTRLASWQQALARSPLVRVADSAPDQGQPLVLGGPEGAPLLYLRRYWDYERQVAAQITERSTALLPVNAPEVKNWLDKMFAPSPGSFDWQRLACAVALRGRFSVITGGPGTGKTYAVARLLALLFATAPAPDRLRVALAAPTGKAAARLKQSIDASLKELHASLGGALDLEALVERVGAARTLHSLLGARPDTRAFAFHHGKPLDVDVLIVDEASMIHLEMMAALLDALPLTARVVFLGDKDQLASVEAGAVLGDLCSSAEAGHYTPETARYALAAAGQQLPAAYLAHAGSALPLAQQTVMLRESRRFGGPIGQLAEAVNCGDSGRALALLQAGESGVLRMREGTPAASVWQMAVEAAPDAAAPGRVNYQAFAQALAARPALPMSAEAHTAWVRSVLTAFERFRLLCAVREGEWGVAGLNRAVEKALAAQGAITPRGEWYAGRPVMVTRNDAALGVFNGDIGVALPGATPGAGLRVYFMDEPKLRAVGVSRLAHVETAFAMTVHKSQGSEFEHTALVLSAHAGSVLGRELVYTGITRARQAFTLMAQAAGLLATAILRPTQRASGLLRFLEQQALAARAAPPSAPPDELAPWVD